MVSQIKNIIAFTVLVLNFSGLSADHPDSPRKNRMKHGVSAGAVISFYRNDIHHTANTKARKGFTISYKSELLLTRKASLLLGLEYFNHGLSFNGYYATPGYTYLYDKTFAYTHELSVNEVQLPLAVKVILNSEKDHLYTPYFFLGVGARYIFGSYAVITNDSTNSVVYDNKATIGFEHEFVTKGLNTFFYGGIGIQRNLKNAGKSVFFEFTYKYGISRFYYSGYQNSNHLFIKGTHAVFAVGYRF